MKSLNSNYQIFNPESFRDKSLKSSNLSNLQISQIFNSSNLSNHPSGYVIRINSFNSCLTPNKKATFQKKMLIFRKVALYKYKE